MHILVLVENEAVNQHFQAEHGLSFYIETVRHHLLFDLGDGDVFLHNAKQFGIDLTKIDCVIISHGHHDHGGGLAAFLAINHTATIYIHEEAFTPHFSMREEGATSIGLDVTFKNHPQIRLIKGTFVIDEELTVFQGVLGTKFYPSSNANLRSQENNQLILDDFRHEQHLLIRERDTTVLMAGCGHRGIVNIVEAAHELIHKPINYVLGGFHMHSRHAHLQEKQETIHQVGLALMNDQTVYFTGHCTGQVAYAQLKHLMHEYLQPIHAGTKIIL